MPAENDNPRGVATFKGLVRWTHQAEAIFGASTLYPIPPLWSSLVRVLLILKTLKVKSQEQQRQLRGFRGRKKEIDMEIT
jgi:hypothetical protein